jgi:serine/threonine protein kinase
MGLMFLHQNKVVYRDLKLSNILLDKHGHVCLADMGLSKDIGDNNSKNSGLSSDHGCSSFVGSPAYVAPQILRRQKYGTSVDWWSFGVVLFQMICGTVPFIGRTSKEVFHAILTENPDFASHPYISPLAKDLISRLLQKKEEHRLCGVAVKEHAFFAGIDWDRLLTKSVHPVHYNPMLSYSPTNGAPTEEESTTTAFPTSPHTMISPSQQRMFADFTFTSDPTSPTQRTTATADNQKTCVVPMQLTASQDYSVFCQHKIPAECQGVLLQESPCIYSF